jgi:hypothetical protein
MAWHPKGAVPYGRGSRCRTCKVRATPKAARRKQPSGIGVKGFFLPECTRILKDENRRFGGGFAAGTKVSIKKKRS